MGDRRGYGVALLGGGSLALLIMVGRWAPSRLFIRSDWLAFPPRVWAVAGLATAVVLCFLLPFNRGPWLAPERAYLRRGVLFLGYMIVSLAWARGSAYATEKATLLGLVLAALILAARLAHDAGPWMARWFWLWMGIASTLYAVFTAQAGWFSKRQGMGERLSTPLGGGPNVFARVMGLLTLLGVTYGSRGARWVWWYLPAAVGVVLTLATGSRGGLLAMIVGLLAYGEARGVFKRRGLLPASLLVAALIAAASTTLYWERAVGVFQHRVLELALEKGDDSGRAKIFPRALQLGLSAPLFGKGLGGYYARDPINEYPHNLFLEAFSEGGIVGLGLLVVFVAGAWRSLAAHRHSDLGTVTWAAFVSLLVASQFSGDLFDSRLLFLLPALRPSIAAAQAEAAS